jgi:hypothetical protein
VEKLQVTLFCGIKTNALQDLFMLDRMKCVKLEIPTPFKRFLLEGSCLQILGVSSRFIETAATSCALKETRFSAGGRTLGALLVSQLPDHPVSALKAHSCGIPAQDFDPHLAHVFINPPRAKWLWTAFSTTCGGSISTEDIVRYT